MTEFWKTVCVELYNVMSQFADGTGNPDDNAVRFLLAAWFFAFALILLSKRLIVNGFNSSHAFLLVGCTFGLIRNGTMFVLEYGFHRQFFHNESLYNAFPMLDHTFQMLTILSINLSILYACRLHCIFIKYYYIIFSVPFIYYIFYAEKWADFSQQISSSNFELFSGNIVYHYTYLAFLISAFVAVIYRYRFIHISMVGYLLFNIMDNVYRAISVNSGLELRYVCDPLSQSYYLWAIPFIIYYVQLIHVKEFCPFKQEANITPTGLGKHVCLKS